MKLTRVPELGCSAWGEALEEAAHEVQDSIEAHLQALRKLGRPIPEPHVATSTLQPLSLEHRQDLITAVVTGRIEVPGAVAT